MTQRWRESPGDELIVEGTLRRRTSFAVACRPEPAERTEETPYQRAATRDFLAGLGIEGPP